MLMFMPERITQNNMLEHCLNAIRKHPYDRIGLEHFVFMKLLEKCPSSEFEEIVNLYRWTIKDE
jgi:hypothetical protein